MILFLLGIVFFYIIVVVKRGCNKSIIVVINFMHPFLFTTDVEFAILDVYYMFILQNES